MVEVGGGTPTLLPYCVKARCMHATTRQTPSVDVHDLPFLVVLLTIGLNLSFHVANCGFPRPPGNGTIVNCTSTARLYQCNSGFGPVGKMTAVCAANWSWSPDPADISCRDI